MYNYLSYQAAAEFSFLSAKLLFNGAIKNYPPAPAHNLSRQIPISSATRSSIAAWRVKYHSIKPPERVVTTVVF